jgi:hypothetical protein
MASRVALTLHFRRRAAGVVERRPPELVLSSDEIPKLKPGETVLMHDHFMDPSFDEMLRILVGVCRICLIEWLRCDGQYKVIPY